MASLREYLEKMSDEELRGILVSYCMGTADILVDSALLVCSILAQRDPELPNPRELFLSLIRMYC